MTAATSYQGDDIFRNMNNILGNTLDLRGISDAVGSSTGTVNSSFIYLRVTVHAV